MRARAAVCWSDDVLQLLPLSWTGFGKLWDEIFEKAYMKVAVES